MEQAPQYFWHEPTLSWKTQEELDQIQIEEHQEIQRLQQEELQRHQEELQRQQKELHKTFVYVDETDLIASIIISDSEFIKTKPLGDGIYIENTNQIKNEPTIGGTYNEDLNAFLPPKPYESWIINIETFQWESPIPFPIIDTAINEPGPGKVYVPQYNAYILPPPDNTWIFNEEKLEFEPPAT